MTVEPSSKRLKSNSSEQLKLCRSCIASFLVQESSIPRELAVAPIKNDVEKLQTLFQGLGFRTSIVKSPRKAMSVYLDSCDLDVPSNNVFGGTAKAFLATAIGMHPHQEELETCYAEVIRNVWCMLLFCKRIEQACVTAINSSPEGNTFQALLHETIEQCSAFIRQESNNLSFDKTERLTRVRKMATDIDHRVRADQLDRELDRIRAFNSTLTNAVARKLFDFYHTIVKDVVFKDSHLPQYRRLSFYLYDPEVDESVPPPFLFMPCLSKVLRVGYHEIVTSMVHSFWSEMLKRGYFASHATRMAIEPNLTKYFQSGLTKDPKIPLIVNAHFSPIFPLSYYFHGKAGAGKSSLVRSFGPSLNAVIERFVDPAVLVRFVKQNLNKSQETLRLELDLRPNNNDMSVMSIIQSRRMTLGQSKPGLVVVGFEEMPDYGPNRDPEQLTTCQLISQRFAGRKGEYQEGVAAPRNSAKRGISGDATIIPIFTSNYELKDDSIKALRSLEMFQEICVFPIHAISGHDRIDFAKKYIGHYLRAKGWAEEEIACIELDIDVGDGDTRPLVRQLRMISFYINRVKGTQHVLKSVGVSQAKGEEGGYTIQADGLFTIELKKSAHGNLYATTGSSLQLKHDDTIDRRLMELTQNYVELSTILSFWLENALAPAVVVTQDEKLHSGLMEALIVYATGANVQILPSVDASQYKMMKSLYDDSETKNLKDDIVALGGGKGDPFVVDLVCPTIDSQLCIREMIEDTPSQTAFSSEKSALHKDGILFIVMVRGEITPEVRSRASLVL